MDSTVRSLAVKAPKGVGESTRKKLIELGVLDVSLRIVRTDDAIIIPVTSIGPGMEDLDVVEEDFEERGLAETDYKKLVDLPGDLKQRLPTSFDTIGDVGIIRLEDELVPHAAEVGRALRLVFPRLRVVALDRGVKGDFRVRELEPIAGEGGLETEHLEYGLHLKVDPGKVYFNPRLANERRRVASLVRPGEMVVDMFAGVGPFAIMIAKYSQAAAVFAIDVNPYAIHYLKENITINKVTNVVPLEGDSREVIFELPCADRLVMNLPHSAREFFADALTRLNFGGTMHLYHICDRSEMDAVTEGLVSEAVGMGVKVMLERCEELKTYSPSASVFSLDLRLLDWF
jgi:tRNA (guanine37-N1)-methyltransferase